MAEYKAEVIDASGYSARGKALKLEIKRQGLRVEYVILKYSKGCFDADHCVASIDLVDYERDEPQIFYENSKYSDSEAPFISAGSDGAIEIEIPQDFAEEILRKLEEEIPTMR